MPPEIGLSIIRGKTFEYGFMYAEDQLAYLPITALASKAPIRLTIENHGVPDGWPVRVACVKQPEELNTPAGEYQIATAVDTNTIELNSLNGLCWKDYLPPGVLILRKPMDLTDWQCRAQVRDRIGGQILFTWHSDPAENPDGLIEVDLARSAFVLTIDPLTTEELPWTTGVYDVEAVSPTGDVYALTAVSPVEVVGEVTV